MSKMWEGRTDGVTNKQADDFNSSIRFDHRLFHEDIAGSIAHAQMLAYKNIISQSDANALCDGLSGILDDLNSGKLTPDPECEDIHMFIEQVLTERTGDVGKKLHTARSRNDQVALDSRMWCKNASAAIEEKLKSIIKALTDKAGLYKSAIMPGYTHMQHAQPVTLGHYLMAYAMMFLRDVDRLHDCKKRTDVSPIGCCALAGTTYDTDRSYEAKLLGFSDVCKNSLDGVSDRDFIIEFLSCISVIMMHLSRLSEELIIWSGWEFGFIELSDSFTTGSSIMPQKKNPDMAELVRGKCGRVYGDLMSVLTTMKGLPLAYNKDMQEDKEPLFDAADTVCACLDITAGMIGTMVANTKNMKKAAQAGFMNATDLADYLVSKGLPFRSAYKISGQIVSYCIHNGKILEDMTLSEYKKFSDIFDDGVYGAIDLQNCVERRNSYGGTSSGSVSDQIKYVNEAIK